MPAMLAHYTGQGITASTVPDASVNANDGTNTGVTEAASPGMPYPGPALQFNAASGQEAYFSAPPEVLPGTSFAFFAWGRPEPARNVQQTFIDDSYTIEITTHTVNAELVVKLGSNYYTASSVPTSGDHAYLIQLDAAGNLEVFIDDFVTPAASWTGVSWAGTGGNTPNVGAQNVFTPMYLWGDKLDEIKIYDGALNSTERAELLVIPAMYFPPAVSLNGTPMAPTWTFGISFAPPAVALGLTAPAPLPTISPIAIIPPAVVLTTTVRGGLAVREPATGIPTVTVYRLTLTGAADALPDIELPLASFQGRARNGEPTYLQVVVPNGIGYSDAITARPNGDLVIRKGPRFADGTEMLDDLIRVALEDIAFDDGGKSSSVTLSGHRTATTSVPKERIVRGLSYRHAGTGKKRYRCQLDTFLAPGDTATIIEYGESIVAGLITYIVSPGQTTMEITEA